MSEPAIVVDGLSKRFRLYHDRNQTLKAAVMRGRRARYEEFWALRDVSLEIAEGATYGFIGTNGSGKSTLLKCLARILVPDEGTVHTRGKVSALLELGAGFHPELSGRENVYLNGSILGPVEGRARPPLRRHRRLRRARAVHRHPGEELLLGHVRAARVLGGHQRRPRHPPRRRGAGRRRRAVPAPLQRALRRPASAGHDDRDRVALAGVGAVDVRRGRLDRPEPVAGHRPGRRPRRPVPRARCTRIGAAEEHATGSRFGSGEVRLERLEVLDREGRATDDVRTGEAVTFRLHYGAAEPIERPTFSVELHTIEGVLLTSPRASEAGLTPTTSRVGGPSTSSSTGCRSSPAPTTCRPPSRTSRRCTSTTPATARCGSTSSPATLARASVASSRCRAAGSTSSTSPARCSTAADGRAPRQAPGHRAARPRRRGRHRHRLRPEQGRRPERQDGRRAGRAPRGRQRGRPGHRGLHRLRPGGRQLARGPPRALHRNTCAPTCRSGWPAAPPPGRPTAPSSCSSRWGGR